MKEILQEDVKVLLHELNKIGKAYIFGGYLRDQHLGLKPSDVDIVTDIPVEWIEQRFSQMEKAKRRITTSGHDVFSFKMHKQEKIFVEIISTKEPLLEKAYQADYTMNAMLHDGTQLIDPLHGYNDLKQGVIKEVKEEIIAHDLHVRPYLWLKTIRLASMTNSRFTQTTYDLLDEHKHVIQMVSHEILQNEGHKTMKGANPIVALEYLAKMGFIAPFQSTVDLSKQTFAIQPQQQLCLLAILTSKQTMDDYAALYHFQPTLIEKYHVLFDYYQSEERVPSRFRNQLITIKKIIQ